MKDFALSCSYISISFIILRDSNYPTQDKTINLRRHQLLHCQDTGQVAPNAAFNLLKPWVKNNGQLQIK